jgi:hypothetical protein
LSRKNVALQQFISALLTPTGINNNIMKRLQFILFYPNRDNKGYKFVTQQHKYGGVGETQNFGH